MIISSCQAWLPDSSKSASDNPGAIQYDGKRVSTQQLQSVSNLIANNVLSDINTLGGVPSIDKLLVRDINIALNENKQTLAGWGGSFYFWNLKLQDGTTVGETISTNPREYIKFHTIYDKASRTVLNKYPLSGGINGSNAYLNSTGPWSMQIDKIIYAPKGK